MEIRFNLNPDALPMLRRIARSGYEIEADSASRLIQLYLHHLANVPLPVKGGSKKGRKLKITDAQRQQRREQAAKARAKKQKARKMKTYKITIPNDGDLSFVLDEIEQWDFLANGESLLVDRQTNTFECQNPNLVDVVTESLKPGCYTIEEFYE